MKTNGRHIDTLPSVLFLTFSLSSACDPAVAYQIVCQLDVRHRIYDVILILKDGGHSVIYLHCVSKKVPTFKLSRNFVKSYHQCKNFENRLSE